MSETNHNTLLYEKMKAEQDKYRDRQYGYPCHDMSLYDIFGILSYGGSIAVPEPDDIRDTSALICVPLSKKLMDILMPSFRAEYSVGFDTTFSVFHYLFVFALVFVTYFIVNALLFGSIKIQ